MMNKENLLEKLDNDKSVVEKMIIECQGDCSKKEQLWKLIGIKNYIKKFIKDLKEED